MKPRRVELFCCGSYHSAAMTAHELGQPRFFDGFRPAAKLISAVGGCLFLVAFFVKDAHGFGRATGLLGIAVVLCGVLTNLVLEAPACASDTHRRRHLFTQVIFTSLLALAVLTLAGYLFRYGHLPSFMPARYQNDHVKRLTEARPSPPLPFFNPTHC